MKEDDSSKEHLIFVAIATDQYIVVGFFLILFFWLMLKVYAEKMCHHRSDRSSFPCFPSLTKQDFEEITFTLLYFFYIWRECHIFGTYFYILLSTICSGKFELAIKSHHFHINCLDLILDGSIAISLVCPHQ